MENGGRISWKNQTMHQILLRDLMFLRYTTTQNMYDTYCLSIEFSAL